MYCLFLQVMLYSPVLMPNNIEIIANNNENATNVLRRFMKKVRSAGFLQVVRGKRYYARGESALRTKKSAMHRIAKRAEYTTAFKAGKTIEK